MRKLCCLTLLLTVCVLVGCGGGRKVEGKLVKDGQPFKVGDKGMIVLAFIPDAATDASVIYNATTKQDGTFTILGPENKGIPPGKYKVQLQALDPYDKGVDVLKGKYAKGPSSPLTVDVASSGQLVVEVPK